MRRGEIYLVNFGKKYNSEFGKIRSALMIQNDIANRNIDKVAFKGVSLLPLTTNITGGTLRVKINKRESLEQVSEVCINEVCTLDLQRIDLTKVLTKLTKQEQLEVDDKLKKHFEIF